MQLWAVLRGNTRINSDQGGWRPLACAGGDQGETEIAVRKDEFAPRRLVRLLNQTGEQCQEFFTHLHPSLISSTNALAELKSIDV